MTPVFVLSPPRARTCWLTVYLQGYGIPAVHEGWKYWPKPDLLRLAMERMSNGIVVNVDSSNPIRLDEIAEHFPTARFINIYRPWDVCVASLRDTLGRDLPDGKALGARYAAAQISVARRAFEITFEEWTPAVSRKLLHWLDPSLPVNPVWDYFCAGLDIQLFSARLNEELDTYNANHIVTIGGELWE
jgi:hypothetical protein